MSRGRLLNVITLGRGGAGGPGAGRTHPCCCPPGTPFALQGVHAAAGVAELT